MDGEESWGNLSKEKKEENFIRLDRLKRKAEKTKENLLLRHSFATHILESCTDLIYIQELLGHKSNKRLISTHVSTRDISRITNPFDDIMGNGKQVDL